MLEILHDWNPWWSQENSIDRFAGKERPRYLSILLDLVEKKHVISVVGIRRCGKTTLLYQLIKHLLKMGNHENIIYLNMDDERLVGLDSPLEKLLQEYNRSIETTGKRTYVFLDEVQNIIAWEKWVKRYYDQKKDYKFIVSGSSSSLLSSDYSSLLTGRNITVEVFPLTFKEYLDFNDFDISTGDEKTVWTKNRRSEDRIIYHLERYMKTGGFPEVVLGQGQHGLLEQYFRDILYRDIIKRHKVRHPEKLELLAIYAMRNISNLLSLRKISRVTGLSVDTVKEYIGYLEEAYMIFTSRNFTRSTVDSLRRASPIKIYCNDVGMANSLLLEPMRNLGSLAENLAARDARSRWGQCFYWRDTQEIDIVVPKVKKAFQVTYGPIRPREMENFSRFPYKDFDKKLISYDVYEPRNGIPIIPLWTFLLQE